MSPLTLTPSGPGKIVTVTKYVLTMTFREYGIRHTFHCKRGYMYDYLKKTLFENLYFEWNLVFPEFRLFLITIHVNRAS